MSRPFLTAEWRNLFLATYAVPPALLEKRLAPGLSLDMRDGNAFVSLVAFEFLRAAPQFPLVRSIVPLVSLGNFAELNLRFYVRRGEERGVVFVREFVPQRLIAWIAKWIYNEPYRAAPVTATRRETAARIEMDYRLRFAGRQHRISVVGGKPAFRPEAGSDEHFFKEHHWGFGVTCGGEALRYQVDHPVWDVYPVLSYAIDLDFAAVYGPEWGFLQQARPVSTVLAVGSEIAVHPKGRMSPLTAG